MPAQRWGVRWGVVWEFDRRCQERVNHNVTEPSRGSAAEALKVPPLPATR
jgi:hypothetical protein